MALVALVSLLSTVLLAGSALAGTGALLSPTSAATGDTAVRSAPAARSVVTLAPASGVPGLVQSQLHEQRTAQLAAMVQAMLQSQPVAPVTSEVDPRVDRESCALLGRTWTDGGCSRLSCVTGHEYAKTGANAETCRIGGRDGSSYGVEIDFRHCDALHRVWIGLLNYCASDPRREEVVVSDAAQCEAPYTSYVVMSEIDGADDECLRPARVADLTAIAEADGRSLAAVAAERSSTQCEWRAQHVYVDGVCTAGAVLPTVRDNVVVVGDSITWRGTNELATLEPDWVIDGSSGRQVDALDERLAEFGAANGQPGGVVFALGTNGRTGWTEEQFRASIETLPADVPVLFVTPFRASTATGRPQLMDVYAGWMQRLVAERPLTCLADWRAAVSTDNALLVDGVHPTSIGEVFWAELVDSSWSTCLQQNGLTSS